MDKLNGARKAAIVLLSLGEETSSLILRNLTKEEIKRIGIHMAEIKGVKKEVSDELLQEFSLKFEEEDQVSIPGGHFLRNLLPSVLGKDEAADMMGRIEKEKEKVPFKYVKEIDAKVLANFIRNEHPQTITVILAHLGHEKAGQVIHFLPENLQFEVINRIAQLEMVPPDLIRDVDEVLEKELLSVGQDSQRILGGVSTVAEILNYCDKRTGENILQAMEERNEELAEKVRKLMFVFDDLAAVNDQGIRELLKEVPNEELTLALKTASEELKSKIFKNLSKRAGEMLQEDLAIMGPARLSDVEAAQQNILNVARRMEKEGLIILAGRDGGDSLV
ncbi:flagellar motor switch protein FliG [Desulforhabdus amnigena]|uniref:Flagellar motor switch protein FliG n=1 Tax=Desulforhabdus amnigena TaxID=40218 RepID=A0A9W6FS21_9BACT|nr:flagellar motor switch protein FliG [Desulforhabdus amnigena]NLJ26609.1 flagellar motor switch protein FliG [Deltaproteobacteria bacterium]GLI33589.1 flagellar motor switch protein FliG [Desulforhabdus amnigena]